MVLEESEVVTIQNRTRKKYKFNLLKITKETDDVDDDVQCNVKKYLH